jgi:hypothetical protein
MSLKAAGLIGPHESVTKVEATTASSSALSLSQTKIRGVLALLKHANILYTESVEGSVIPLFPNTPNNPQDFSPIVYAG